jgi:hypothetical protein
MICIFGLGRVLENFQLSETSMEQFAEISCMTLIMVFLFNKL